MYPLLILLSFCLTPPAQSPGPPATIRILANRHIYRHTDGRVQSIGNVRVFYRDFELTADEIETDTVSQEIEALGHIVFTQGERVMHTERLHYRLQDRSGNAENVEARVETFLFEGRRIDLTEDQLRLKDASLTSCNLPHPHYHISAREITVDQDRRLRARHISFYFGKTRLFVWPSLSMRIGKEQSGGISPRVDYSHVSGPSAGLAWSLPSGEPISGGAYLGLSLWRGPVGEGQFERPGKTSVRVKASLQEEPPRKRVADVLLDRLPEVEVGFPEIADSRKNLRFLPSVNAGFYRERPGRRQTTRWQGKGILWGPEIRFTPSWRAQPALQAASAWYGSGERYSALDAGWNVDYYGREEPLLGFGYFRRTTSGRTPFAFDEVDLSEELQARIALGGTPNRLNLLLQYDLRRGGFYNLEFTLRWRLHCLEPRITWKTRQRALGISLSIVNLSPE